MAEEKKTKKKDKKKLIILVGLVAAVVLTVSLVLFLPKGRTSKQNLNDISSITMADNQDIKADYETFVDKIDDDAGVDYYSNEMQLISMLNYAMDEVADYYNEYYPLANKTGAYAPSINGAIGKIRKAQKQLIDILNKVEKDSFDGQTYLQNAWIDYRSAFVEQVKAYKTMFKSLNKMYHKCLGNSMSVNNASKLVLSTVDDYMTVLTESFTKLVEEDVKGNKEADYSLGNITVQVTAFSRFVNKYIAPKDRTFIQNYILSSKDDCEYLNAFYSKFNEKNFENVLRQLAYSSLSITSTYTNEEVTADDSDALTSLNKVKSFVLGGL